MDRKEPIRIPFEKELIFIALYLFWLVGYFSVPLLGITRGPYILEWDPVWHFPVLPVFIIPYLSAYVMPFVVLATARDRAFLRRFALAVFIAMLVSFAGFYLVPLALSQPIEAPSSPFARLLQWQRSVDRTNNFFPSLHVSTALLMALAVGWQKPRWRGRMLAWAGLVAVSTLFTRLHYAVDVLGGITVAVAAWTLIVGRRSRS